jgi:hypothetical protein
MTEDADLTGFYTASISGEVFPDDTYTALFYSSSALTTLLQTRTQAIVGDFAADPGGGTASLLEYALTGLAEMKTELRIAAGETAEDDRIILAINEATDAIETACGRRIKRRAASMTRYFDVDDDDEDEELWPPEWPFEAADIVSLSTAYLGDFATGTVYTYSASEYRVEGSQRIVLLEGTADYEFYCGPQTVKLEWYPGYTTPLADIVGVCKSKAARIYWRDKGQQAGVESESVNGQTITRTSDAWTVEEKAVLDRYTRPKDYKRKRRDGMWTR